MTAHPLSPRSSNLPGSSITPTSSAQARFYASTITSWYLHTLDPHVPNRRNIECRLRHPVHVVTRRILYGHVDVDDADRTKRELELIFNNDDGSNVDDDNEVLSRRSMARMEAFLASCSVALREEDEKRMGNGSTNNSVGVGGGNSNSGAGNKLKSYRQIGHADLMHRLELHCRTLRRIRSIADANPTLDLEECVIQYESRKTIKSRVYLIIQTFLHNVDCVRDVHKTLKGLILRETLGVLAVEVCCDELRSTIDRLTSEYEHKVSFASLAFLSSPDASAETHLTPLLTKYFEYLQTEYRTLVSQCELERMLRAVLDSDLRHFFKEAVFHSVGHILDVCRSCRESLDNIALPPPWKEGVFGLAGGGVNTNSKDNNNNTDGADNMDKVIQRYCNDDHLVEQALKDLRREVITVNGQVISPAHSSMELAENLGRILNSNQMFAHTPKSKRKSAYTSDFGLEIETDYESNVESSDGGMSKIEPGLVDVLTRRLLIAASRTGAGGDAYFIVRDLFGGDEVEVIPNHQSQHIRQGTIEILVKTNAVIIKSHGKFDIVPKPVGSDSEALIQFHTTTTETIELEQKHDAAVTLLKEKKTNMTGWRTLAIRPAYYEKIPSTR